MIGALLLMIAGVSSLFFGVGIVVLVALRLVEETLVNLGIIFLFIGIIFILISMVWEASEVSEA